MQSEKSAKSVTETASERELGDPFRSSQSKSSTISQDKQEFTYGYKPRFARADLLKMLDELDERESGKSDYSESKLNHSRSKQKRRSSKGRDQEVDADVKKKSKRKKLFRCMLFFTFKMF